MEARNTTRGFTLLELIVVFVIIAVLTAFVLPAVVASRESARDSTCKNHLRQFGIAMSAYAETSNGYLSSGAFDWKQDGVPTEVGWVANLVNRGVPVGAMQCPSNSGQLSETYNDLLTVTASTPGFSCKVDHSGSTPRQLPDGTTTINPCRIILGTWNGSWTAPWGTIYNGGTPLLLDSEDRRKLVEEMIYKRGYNTNYLASWWLVRSGVILDVSGNLVQASGTNDLGTSCPAASNKERMCTTGPLNLRLRGSWAPPSSNIPLLGDAASSNMVNATLVAPMGPHGLGVRLTQSFSNGPVLNTTMQPPAFPAGTPRGGPLGWQTTWGGQTHQDFRAFAPIHRHHANIVMTDGSVRTFVDQDKDGYLNSGFDPARYTGIGELGFTEKSDELAPEELFSGYSLKRGDQTALMRP